ncbi:phage protease [uncultured Roseibium sp.]|uniref:phage protease n=1 Tax=uncultured Roseibium sp. TaxID=1936171 RepID=UPI0025967B5C|nr:phage protease [uncultured Roseibium sp.]
MATTVNSPRSDTHLIAASDAVAASSDASAWIRLLPAGTFTCRDGRGPFHAGDSAALQAILSQTQSLLAATEMMVDYDHQSIFGAVEGVGGTAKAAGWIKGFEIRDDGIYGQVEWTEAASAAIKAREYRYISPLFTVEKTTGKVMALRNAALVNMPALDLEAIAARFSSSTSREPKVIPMKQIALALGLAGTASEAEILAAIAATQQTQAAIAAAAGLEPTATSDDITAAIRLAAETATPDPAKYVPIDQVTAMQADLKALKQEHDSDKAGQLVAAAIEAGKLSPALKDWGMELCLADPAKFTTFTASAPTLTGPQLGSAKKDPGDPALDDSDLQVAAQMGLSADAMIASKKELG